MSGLRPSVLQVATSVLGLSARMIDVTCVEEPSRACHSYLADAEVNTQNHSVLRRCLSLFVRLLLAIAEV